MPTNYLLKRDLTRLDRVVNLTGGNQGRLFKHAKTRRFYCVYRTQDGREEAREVPDPMAQRIVFVGAPWAVVEFPPAKTRKPDRVFEAFHSFTFNHAKTKGFIRLSELPEHLKYRAKLPTTKGGLGLWRSEQSAFVKDFLEFLEDGVYPDLVLTDLKDQTGKVERVVVLAAHLQAIRQASQGQPNQPPAITDNALNARADSSNPS